MTEANKTIQTMQAKIGQQESLLERQAKQILDAELYSKKYNLKLYNIPEDNNESQSTLLKKLKDILGDIGINMWDLYIDNIHRLPSGGKGPKPVIITFVSKLDRDYVWYNNYKLKGNSRNIFMREHFDSVTEKNICTLLPIRREALLQKRKVKLMGDKLSIEGKIYTVSNLKTLPPELDPRKIATKETENYLFFYIGDKCFYRSKYIKKQKSNG